MTSSTSRLFLMRHGETDWNLDGRTQGTTDIPLNDAGLAQAHESAAELAPMLGPDTRIVSSPLARAVVTAEALADAAGTTAEVDERLVQRSYGPWERLTKTERAAQFPEEAAAWADGVEPLFAGYENHASIAVRFMDAVGEYVREGADTVFVSHGGTTRVATLALLGLPLDLSDRSVVPHVSNARWLELARSANGAWNLTS